MAEGVHVGQLTVEKRGNTMAICVATPHGTGVAILNLAMAGVFLRAFVQTALRIGWDFEALMSAGQQADHPD